MRYLQKIYQHIRLFVLLLRSPKTAITIIRVRFLGLTYLRVQDLCDLVDAIDAVQRANVKGILLEAGSAAGGSALVMASAKTNHTPLHLYDVFAMIPPPSERDGQDIQERFQVINEGKASGINGEVYYGYQTDLLTKIATRFEEFKLNDNVQLIKGLYQDSLKDFHQPVALAHIDCDWYDSVMTCLQAIEPYLQVGGTLVIDDYYTWSGCKDAVDQYFKSNHENYVFTKKGRLHIKKIA